MSPERWEYVAREVRIWFWFTASVVLAGVLGGMIARNFVVREATRCLEAPDMDTARVCWDAATLGWKP